MKPQTHLIMNRKFFSHIGILLILLIPFHLFSQHRWSTDYVFYDKGGALSYTPDEQGNIIPDFSHVGYQYGDDTIPYVDVKVTVNPVEGDDAATIQAAIDAVAAMPLDEHGFRGAVLLKAGTYQVETELVINASGIVLRGEGDTDAGTVIIAAGKVKRDFIIIDNGLSRVIDASTKVNISESYVPLGRQHLVVADASAFSAGDDIVIYRPGTQKWISDIKMDQISSRDDGGATNQWTPSSYSYNFERTLTAVSGDTLFFRNPVVMAMEDQYGGGTVSKCSFDRLDNIGIEDLCLKSEYASETDEDHAWQAVVFYSAEHSWMRNVTAWHFGYCCVSVESKSQLISVINCHDKEPKSIVTGGRRYAFNLNGTKSLFRECTSTEARHAYIEGSRMCGPSVFTNCSATGTSSDIGPHQRWATGVLYDKIVSDGAINVRDRDNMGSGHGWAGANHVLWNCKAAFATCQSPWTSALNYNFGFIGDKSPGFRPDRPDGVWVGHNQQGIFPASLYEAQLDARRNDTKVFTATSSTLEQVEEDTFVMSFNMPIATSQLSDEYFIVSGTAGAQDKAYTITLNDEYSVKISFDDLGLLPANSTIIVEAVNLTSSDAVPLTGIAIASFVAGDLRPVVTGIELTVDNETGFVVASSSKLGEVYLIKNGPEPNSKADLDSLVSIGQGVSATVLVANVSVPLYTKGLIPGYYNYYAVDSFSQLSAPDMKWVKVTPASSAIDEKVARASFRAYKSNGMLYIEPEDQNEEYSIDIFNTSGHLVYTNSHLSGLHSLPIYNLSNLLIIRKTTLSKGSEYVKIVI